MADGLREGREQQVVVLILLHIYEACQSGGRDVDDVFQFAAQAQLGQLRHRLPPPLG